MDPWRPSNIPAWPTPWDPEVELDWGDPTISARLLHEHLDQSHDGASRRLSTVAVHVARLRRLLPPAPARVLDAGCGPGLYAVPLAEAGYAVTGVDVGPAVLAHARDSAANAGVTLETRLSDLRRGPLGDGYDAALLIYFVLDGFRARDGAQVLRKVARSVKPGGRVIAEVRARPDHPPGRLTTWDVVPRSLLADRAHLLLVDTVYDEVRATFVLREVAVLDDHEVLAQQTTTRLFDHASIDSLCNRAGLCLVSVYDGWSRRRATSMSATLLIVADRPL